ncbi:MAG TPA: flagellar assembly protein FliX [Caulobacteraceae bacterium]|nr:flagellar assembly protein FliX [Caulobacteraceae bacterium]
MKVSGSAGPGRVVGAMAARPAASAPGFAPAAAAAPASEATSVAAAGAAAQVNSLDALMALQEVGGPLQRRRRAVARAGNILTALEGLKLELLDGRLSRGGMEALTRAVRDQRALTDDPKLEGLLDEIETRAAVELAKLASATVAA